MERRLSAVLAADMVGYSRLMEADEIGTIERQKVHRRELIDPSICSFKGRIAKEMGDGILVEFPSVVDAVQCAVAIQRAMGERESGLAKDKQIAYRIGINLGDIVVEPNDIYGDGINVAARLEQLAEPGGICISGTVFDQIEGRSEFACIFLGEQRLKNISRLVRAYRVSVSPDNEAKPASKGVAPPLSLPQKPSIAVLPFQNISGDPEQEYFADGMVEDIITALSRANWLFVIARNSCFTYKGKAVDVKQVGRELGVRYVLEGSVRKAANRIRITGQLIDAATGAHLWADHFDGDMTDVFDLQDRVTASVAGAIAPKLEEAEIERTRYKPTESLGAYDYYLRGMAAFHAFSEDNNTEAIGLFSKAFELDRNFAAAYGMVARCYIQRKGFHWIADANYEIAQTAWMARRAAELGRNDSIALAEAGAAMVIVLGELKAGSSLIEQSLAINPNLAWAVSFSAQAMAFLGDPEKALDRAALAMRLSPQDPQMFGMQIGAAWAYFFAHRFEEALSLTEIALARQSAFFLGICVEAASAAKAGKIDQARAAMVRIRQINPDLSISNLKDFLHFARQQDFDLWSEGLTEAGLSK